MYEYKLRSKTFTVRESESQPNENLRCCSPRAAVPILRSLFASLSLDVNQEHMVVIALNSRGKVIGHKLISSGTDTCTVCNPGQVFRAALVLGGTSVIMCHNHPSGDSTPSREDGELTKRCLSAGEILSVSLADHSIIGAGDDYHSFRTSENWSSVERR